MSSTTKSSKSNPPMRPVDPQPIRSPSPAARGNSYPPPPSGKPPSKSRGEPESQSQPRYNPQDYTTQSYNPQRYSPQNYNTQNYNPQSYDPQAYNNQPPTSQPPTSQPYTSQPYNPQDYGPPAASTARPSTQMATTFAPTSLRELQALKTNCQFGLREYLSLQRRRQTGDSAMSPYELDTRIRAQAGTLLSDLRVLQSEVRDMAKKAESHRWRRWIIGGAIATFIPFIRKFFRRTNDEESQTSSNDTEYAFRKSKGLLDYIKDGFFGTGYFAKLAFLVFAVLYVFSNEVSLRVARTTQKRVKRLCARIERGDPDIDEKDMKVLEGWRWRVLLWWNQRKVDFFNDPICVMQVTKTLLKLDFDLQIELPDDRLCPPVMNRHNYVLWLKGLLDTSSYETSGKIVGLDIGTGASCIYPLLGCTQRPWSFIATDIDARSLEFASKNVALNNLQDRVNVVQRKPEDSVIPLDDLGIDSIDFTMNNPPFYKSEEDMANSAAQKSRPPLSACTGAKVEMVTEGGEVGFVDRILQESLVLRERVQWYTAMFGFLTSIVDFVEKLRENGIDNYAVTEFVQGSKTRRWAIAWSFGPMRPAQEVARGIHTAVSKSVLPDITEVEVVKIPTPEKIGDFADRFSTVVAKLELMSWDWDRTRLEGTGRAVDKVWARAWRRRKQREMVVEKDEKKPVDTAGQTCKFAFKIFIRVGKEHVMVGCRWVEGHDASAFESFQGYLKSTTRSVIEGKA
ncbi:hypothetical protein B0J13DRAFT_431525 [Dactylonectria estremocensis]|uniref:U6 small nuclear RNA (adenine-(43)-N(6))-methyltransferase n=1 Tax=Dactylonectria estremocensis TaxID=1079267 RepID=A0A9P9FJK9_9HYPO|nr:hypothetical protein B0J13DRAFT_431525 [Dactylonectria estremocensis]